MTFQIKIKRINQNIACLEQKKRHLKERMNMTNSSLRKKRTRTLIQLGGLIEISGILPKLNIALGDDLQRDEEAFEASATLMGALNEIVESFDPQSFEQQKLLWNRRGKKLLQKHIKFNKAEV